mmetsp:Transcript_25816/g.70013  ORF Transcript_25816/g.70013 Transcript_25816/m.70013 type:complete len:207 (+) Transcript_25816:3945-4565(+)
MAIINAAVVFQEALLGHLLLDLGIVQVGVEHDHAVGQHIRDVGTLEGVGVALQVALGKLLHQAVDLLGFPWQPESSQEGANGHVKLHVLEVQGIDEGVHDLNVEVLALSKVASDCGLVQILGLQQEHRDIIHASSQHALLLQKLQAFFGLCVEERHSLLEAGFVGTLGPQVVALTTAGSNRSLSLMRCTCVTLVAGLGWCGGSRWI